MKKLIFTILLILPIMVNADPQMPLALEDAITITLENNYGIIVQQKNLEIAQTSNSWGAVGALPSIDLTGMASRTENYSDASDYKVDNYSGSVELNWVLFRGFGAMIDKSKLDEIENLSQGNLDVVVENTLTNVILSYYNILLQQENVRLTQKLMDLSNDRYESEKHKVDLGSSVTYNLLQAQNSYLEDKSNYLAAKANYNNAVRQLNYLMAEPLEQEYLFTSSFKADTQSFEKSTLIERMLAENSTLKNQFINLELTKLDVRSARSSFAPVISANASAGYSKIETQYDTYSIMDNTVSGYNTSYGLRASFTLFDGNKKWTALQVAKLDEKIAEVQIEEMQKDLKNQLAQEYELYEVRLEMMKLADENLKAAELNLKISKQKFDTGSINSFNYRDIQQLYLSAALAQHNAVYDVIQSYHSLLRLTGGLIGEYN